MDNTIVDYMEQLGRITNRKPIHLGALEKCRSGLINYLQEIVREKSSMSAQKAKNTLAMYSHVLAACREQRADFFGGRFQSCLTNLNILIRDREEMEPPTIVVLNESNWSVKQQIFGRIKCVSSHPDLNELMSLRGGYFGTMIYLMGTRPSIPELLGWPDKQSVIVSTIGGENSEDMNYARSVRLPYINSAQGYYEDLRRLDGKTVILSLSSTSFAQIEDLRVSGDDSRLYVQSTLLPPVEYIDHVVKHPKVKEAAYALFAWCMDSSEVGMRTRERLMTSISTERSQHYVSEGRFIPRKDYPEGYKLIQPSEIVRALARFAIARERRELNYARKVARAFTCEPLAQILVDVLSEDERKIASE